MKKILVIFGLIILTGCSLPWQNPAKKEVVIEKISQNKSVQSEISILQNRIDKGEITESEAREILKKNISDKNNLNDGSTKSILKKWEMIDPQGAKILEEKIRQNHPEELE